MIGVAFLVAAFSGPATAGPGDRGTEPDEPIVAQYADAADITSDEAARRLDLQTAVARDLVPALKADARLAGIWFDDDDGLVHISTVGDDSQWIETLIADAGLEVSDFGLGTAEHSYRELLGYLKIAERLSEESADPSPYQGGIDDEANVARFSIEATHVDKQRAVAIADQLRAVAGDTVRLETHDGFPQPDAGCAYDGGEERLYCDSPLRGGVRITRENGGSNCTAGFNARSRTDNKPYLLTAGHCSWNQGDMIVTKLKNGVDVENIGPLHRREFDGGTEVDAAIVRNARPRFWKVRPWVVVRASPNQNGVNGTVADSSYVINAVAEAQQGWRVCTTGAIRETECGKVTDADQFLCYDGSCIAHLKRTNQRNIGAGDSGGPTYAGRSGVHNGYGMYVAHNPVSSHRFHMDLGRAEDAMNVNVVVN